jgi:hypothetical protein
MLSKGKTSFSVLDTHEPVSSLTDSSSHNLQSTIPRLASREVHETTVLLVQTTRTNFCFIIPVYLHHLSRPEQCTCNWSLFNNSGRNSSNKKKTTTRIIIIEIIVILVIIISSFTVRPLSRSCCKATIATRRRLTTTTTTKIGDNNRCCCKPYHSTTTDTVGNSRITIQQRRQFTSSQLYMYNQQQQQKYKSSFQLSGTTRQVPIVVPLINLPRLIVLSFSKRQLTTTGATKTPCYY